MGADYCARKSKKGRKKIFMKVKNHQFNTVMKSVEKRLELNNTRETETIVDMETSNSLVVDVSYENDSSAQGPSTNVSTMSFQNFYEPETNVSDYVEDIEEEETDLTNNIESMNINKSDKRYGEIRDLSLFTNFQLKYGIGSQGARDLDNLVSTLSRGKSVPLANRSQNFLQDEYNKILRMYLQDCVRVIFGFDRPELTEDVRDVKESRFFLALGNTEDERIENFQSYKEQSKRVTGDNFILLINEAFQTVRRFRALDANGNMVRPTTPVNPQQ